MKKENKKEKLYLIIAIFLVLISVLMLWNTLINKGIIPLKTMNAYATLTVSNHTGFDLNKTALSFGTVTSGAKASRNITISNYYNFPVRFEFEIQGNISDLLIYEKNVYLKPKETKNLAFFTNFISNETKQGFYSGKVIIKVKK